MKLLQNYLNTYFRSLKSHVSYDLESRLFPSIFFFFLTLSYDFALISR